MTKRQYKKLGIKPTLERDLQKAVLDWLAVAGYYFKRIPIGAYPYRQKNGSVKWGVNPMRFFPDIFVILKRHPGMMVCIELKSADGRLSKGQQLELAKLTAAGVFCIVARDLMTVIDALGKLECSTK